MIINSECLDFMKILAPNSVDTIITDPPYGLKFMGKKWDYDVPSVEIWKECLRVLKPGGTALIFAGSRTQHRMACNVEDAGFILKDCIMWLYGSGFPKALDIGKNTDESWNGWKSHGLKPAYEPILVAIKPNDGNYVQNALKWSVSGLNIDGGRIEGKIKKVPQPLFNRSINGIYNTKCGEGRNGDMSENNKGRFPANIILDEEVAKMLDEQSDASRFFYCAKASKSERNAGCKNLPVKQKIFNGQSDSSSKEIKNVEERFTTQPSSNHHPTVKPLKLMEYLCKLTKTPTGGLVLDPFAGSGSTGLAAKNTGRDFILIEREAEYCEIVRARLGKNKRLNFY